MQRFAAWFESEGLPDDVAQLAPEHLVRFPASAAAQRRPDGKAKRRGSLNALRSGLRALFGYLERATPAKRTSSGCVDG